MCHSRTQISSKFMHCFHIFLIPVNFLPFVLVDTGLGDSSAGFGAGAGAGAQPGANGAAGEAANLVTFPEVGDFVMTSGTCMGMARLPTWRREWCFWMIVLGSSTGRSSGAFW